MMMVILLADDDDNQEYNDVVYIKTMISSDDQILTFNVIVSSLIRFNSNTP